MTDQTLRVVIADDHARTRAYIRGALEAGGHTVCGEGATADDAIRLAKTEAPDVILLDIRMPGGGILAAREITRSHPDLPVVMLTQSTEDDDLFDSLRAGASGYLLKDMDPARLPDMVRVAMRGEAALSRRLVGRVMDEFSAQRRRKLVRKPAPGGALSPREWEVMTLLGDGLSTEQVAERLGLSPATVRVHVSSVLKKLRVKDRKSAFEALRKP